MEKYKKELEKLKKQLIDGYNPDKIILFGSMLDENLKNPNDIDLLVIKDEYEDIWERNNKIIDVVDIDVPKDIITINFKELEERKRVNDFFIMNILNNGKVLYEK